MAAAVAVQQSSDQGVIQQAAKKRERYCARPAVAQELQPLVMHLQCRCSFSPFCCSSPAEKVLKEPKTSVPVLLVVAGAAAAYIWWNKQRSSGGKGSRGDSPAKSHFAFPGGKVRAKCRQNRQQHCPEIAAHVGTLLCRISQLLQCHISSANEHHRSCDVERCSLSTMVTWQ